MCSDSALSMSQLHNGSQAAKVTPVAGLVDCLVKIGGISEAQAALHQHLPNQVLKSVTYSFSLCQCHKPLDPCLMLLQSQLIALKGFLLTLCESDACCD